MFKNHVQIGLLLSFLAIFNGCSNVESPQYPNKKIIPVKGDPLTFIKNTSTQTEGLPSSLFEATDSWDIQIRGFFTEEQTSYEDQSEVLSKNKAPSESNINTEERLSLVSLKKDKTGILTLRPNNNKGIQLQLSQTGDLVKVKNILFVQENILISNLRVHHYSVKEGTQIFSILLSFYEGPNHFLLNFVFIPEQERTILSLLNKTYNYMFGPGVPYRWSKEKTLRATICNSNPNEKTVEWTKNAAASWKSMLEDRLRFETHVETVCPPFSDLNTHVVVHVKDWIEVYQEGLVAAQTSLIVNHFNYEILDSDIFVPEADWDEAIDGPGSFQANLENPELEVKYTRTIKHELGHFKGMHHMFEKPSIMNYDETLDFTDYDSAAIHELYPVIE